jgi:hypothetical protein
MEAHVMTSIPQDTHSHELLSKNIIRFFRTYHVSKLLRAANAYKCKGISVVTIFMMAFSVVFVHKSLYMQWLLRKDSVPFSKDTLYRLMNSCHIHWRQFTMLLSASIIADTIQPLTNEDRIQALIIDDTLFTRARSKKVELLAKVYDHAKGLFTFGFRMLTLCWTDGNTTLPVSYCLLSTSNAKNLITPAVTLDGRTHGAKQRKLAQRKTTDVALQLLTEAKAVGIAATHVLFDTWFCSPTSLLAIKVIGYDVIAMTKKSSKIQYRYNGIRQDVKQIYQQNKKRRGRSRYLLSVAITVQKKEQEIPARLVYVRNRHKRNQYLVLITTDMTLSEEEVIRIYGKRWGIEVFFKMCKSYLRLSKECHSLSYDAMTAHVAIVCSRYMMIAVAQRQTKDTRSFGELFYWCSDEMPDIRFAEALRLLMVQFQEILSQEGVVLEELVVQKLLDVFVDTLPAMWRQNLQYCA